MRKSLLTIVLLVTSLTCLTTSCKKEDEKKNGENTVTEKIVDYQLRVYLTADQLKYLDCEVKLNVPGKEEQTVKIEEGKSDIVKADTVIDDEMINVSNLSDNAPQIYVCTIDNNGLKAGEAKATICFTRNTVECKDTAETVDIAMGAIWSVRTDGQRLTPGAKHLGMYNGVYVQKLEEFLQATGNTEISCDLR